MEIYFESVRGEPLPVELIPFRFSNLYRSYRSGAHSKYQTDQISPHRSDRSDPQSHIKHIRSPFTDQRQIRSPLTDQTQIRSQFTHRTYQISIHRSDGWDPHLKIYILAFAFTDPADKIPTYRYLHLQSQIGHMRPAMSDLYLWER